MDTHNDPFSKPGYFLSQDSPCKLRYACERIIIIWASTIPRNGTESPTKTRNGPNIDTEIDISQEKDLVSEYIAPQ